MEEVLEQTKAVAIINAKEYGIDEQKASTIKNALNRKEKPLEKNQSVNA